MSYTDRERVSDLRRVVGALESGGRNFDEDTAEAARRLERLSSVTVLELVLRVRDAGVALGLRAAPAPREVNWP